VFGAIGADGRVVDDPVVVPGAILSATRGPLQGAHINKSPNTSTAAMAAIIPAPIPPRKNRPTAEGYKRFLDIVSRGLYFRAYVQTLN
jgi:hypothetical protein